MAAERKGPSEGLGCAWWIVMPIKKAPQWSRTTRNILGIFPFPAEDHILPAVKAGTRVLCKTHFRRYSEEIMAAL